MKASEINDVISFKSRHNLIKSFLYMKLSEYKGLKMDDGKLVKLSENDLNILSLFACTDDKQEVIKTSFEKNYIRSLQSGENTVTRFVNLGILVKTGKKKRSIHSDILPKIDSDIVVFKTTTYNNGNKLD